MAGGRWKRIPRPIRIGVYLIGGLVGLPLITIFVVAMVLVIRDPATYTTDPDDAEAHGGQDRAIENASVDAPSEVDEPTPDSDSGATESEWWPDKPVDGVWELPDYADLNDLVAFGQASPDFGRCHMNDPDNDCDYFTVVINEAPVLEPSDGARDTKLTTTFTVTRTSAWGEYDARSQVDLIWLSPGGSPSIPNEWDEVSGKGRVQCPDDDVAVGRSMDCTVALDLSSEWVENSHWDLVGKFQLGTWPSQGEPDQG